MMRRVAMAIVVITMALAGLLHPTTARAIGNYPSAPWAVPTTGTVGFTYGTPTGIASEPLHTGIDIWTGDGVNKQPAPGNPIYAAYTGTVVKLLDACDNPYPSGADPNDPSIPMVPSIVIVQHEYQGQTIWTLYAHMAQYIADSTKQNDCGDPINGAPKARSFILVRTGEAVDWTTQIGSQGDCCTYDNPYHVTHLHFQVNTAGTPSGLTGTADPTFYITGNVWGTLSTGAPAPIPSRTSLTYNGSSMPPPGGSSQAILQLPKSDGTDACQDQSLPANDDGSTGAVPLPFTANFFGNSYGAVFLNNNGNVTFNGPQSTYTPFPLLTTQVPIIAPFFADVDTRGGGSSPLTYSYGDGIYAGHPTLCADWVNVGYFGAHSDKLNSFQLLLIDRSDTGPGNFDIMFNYNQIQWETGDASGGGGGFGGSCARIGYSNGTSTSFELPGSAVCGSFLDSNPGGLIHGSLNSTQPGRYIFAVRNGVAPTGGTIFGHVFASSNNPANALSGAFVQVCSASSCNNTLTDANGGYTVSGLADGSYTATAFPPGGSSLFQNSVSNLVIAGANTLSGQDIVLQGPAPLPNGTTITNRYVDPSGIPVIYWQDRLTLTTQGCAGGTASYQITLADGTVASSGGMTEGPSGTYTASIAPLYPNHGNAHVAITINCPSGTPVNTAFDIYIDPSGTVQTVGGAPIAGATVTLYRSDSSSGPFDVVPNGSGIMSVANRNNPDTTDADGHFGWDVIAGFYKVRASKAGCVSPTDPTQAFVDSDVLSVPPAVTDLVLTLDCRGADSTPPTTTASATVGSSAYTFGNWTNQGVQVALNATDNSGGSGIAQTYYAVDDSTCATTSLSTCTTYSGNPFTVSGAGTHTITFFSTDNAGNVEATNTATINIDLTPPTTTASATIGSSSTAYTFGTLTNQSVQVTLNASDDSGGSGVANTYYAVDNAACAPSALANCTTYGGSPFTISGDGTHTVAFFSVDNAGNVEATNTVTATIDATPPTTTASATLGTGSSPYTFGAWTNQSVKVTLSATDTVTGSGVAHTYDAVDKAACTTTALTSCATYTGSPLSISTAGVHTLTYFSQDVAGNLEPANTAQVKIDKTAPTCVLSGSGTNVQGQKYIQITVRDTASGLAGQPNGVVVTENNNATMSLPTFTAGTTGALVVTATKIDQSQGSQVALRVTDQAGNVTNCDPVLTSLIRDSHQPTTTTATGILQSEHLLHIYNGNPGLTHLTIKVNGKKMHERDLSPNQQYTIDIGAALQPGSNNIVTVIARGKQRGEATIVIADS